MAKRFNLSKEEALLKIQEKKEFSDLPKRDVEKAYCLLDSDDFLVEEKIKKTRDLLRKVYTVFSSEKLLQNKNFDPDWVLKKHISTRERYPFYKEIYSKIFKNFKEKNLNVFDLGAGVNGFSYSYFPSKVSYTGIEAIGQLVDLTNSYFKKENFNAISIHESLFEIEKIKKMIDSREGKKIVFLFKVLDSLEMLEKDFSKKLIKELISRVDLIVISFATESLISRKKFRVNRDWILKFIEKEFLLLEDFSFGGERYISFKKR